MLRILSGDSITKIPAVIKYPMYDPVSNTQNFPARTFTMIVCLLLEIGVSGE